MMSVHRVYEEIARDFEQVAHFIERAIENLSGGESGSADLDKLHRAKAAAIQGAALARSAVRSSRSASA
jgi:hypothetical protein